MAENPRITELRGRLAREPGSRLFAQLAEELRKDGQLDEAIRVCREGLERHPAYPSARMTLGRSLFDTGDLAGARGEFEAVIKGAPDNILAGRLLGECLEGLGDLAGAADRYRATLGLAPGDRNVQARLDAVEAQSRTAAAAPGRPLAAAPEPPGVAPPGEDLPPIPLSSVGDEAFEIETSVSHATEPGPSPVAGERHEVEPPPIPLVAMDDDSFEVETGPGSRPSGEAAEPLHRPLEPVSPPKFAPEGYELESPYVAPATLPFQTFERLRQSQTAQEPQEGSEGAPGIASATLAELYVRQGFADRALAVYRQILERQPHNAAARARVQELERAGGPGSEAAEGDEPSRRRAALRRTIARLEGFLAAARKG